MLSNQAKIVQTCLVFISNLRLKKPRITSEEKALICLKFVTLWLIKKLDKGFFRSNSDKSQEILDQISEIKEEESPFSDYFMKEIQNSKTSLFSHSKKLLSGDVSPLKSRSPNISIIENPIEAKTEEPSLLKDIREAHFLIKTGNSKILALSKLMDIIEQALATGQKKAQNKVI